MATLNVPITKGKSTVQIDTEAIPQDVYAEALLQGLKVLLNRNMSKITKASTKDEAEMKSLAMEQAEKNIQAVMEGKIRFTGGKAKKASGAVMTEAMRLAKGIIKDQMKAQGLKVSHYPAAEITKAAKALLEQDESIVETAKVNIEARSAKAEADKGKLDLSAIMAPDPKLVAAAEAKRKGKSDVGTISATQAGQTKKRKAQPALNA